ncbi:juvenile hormone acid O-methyltransferase-like [Lutzomyia longipalpis]|nr:juvenile hormone acid O-methyltransferase-like [Lutzomyia longipalpis]
MKNFNNYKPEVYAASVDWRYNVLNKIFTNNADKLQWRGDERVLDIGCGVADITRHVILPMLSPDYKKLSCADASTLMLSAAEKQLQDVKKVEFIKMDIGADLEKSLIGQFDRIFSTFCLMYLKDQRKTFQNVFDLLAPGGDCFIVILSSGIIFETLFQLAETPKWREHLKHVRDVYVFPYREDPDPEKTLTSLLRSVGFTDVFVKKDKSFSLYENADRLRDNLLVMPDFPHKMTQQEREELFEDQIKLGISMNVVAESYDESKPILQARHVTLTIKARKPVL